MTGKSRVQGSLAILACLWALLAAQPALACSVCFGDPTSAISEGAQAGMLVLLGVIGSVLLSFAGLLIFWIRRAAQLENEGGAVGKADVGGSGASPNRSRA